MSLIDNYSLRLLRGLPLIFKDICLIYSPKLDEIARIGLDKFYKYLSFMLIEKPYFNATEEKDEDSSKLKELMSKISDFEYLILLSQMDAEQHDNIKEAFKFFTHEDNIIISQNPPSVIFGEVTEKRILTAENFLEFQNIMNKVCAMDNMDSEEIIIRPDDPPEVVRIKKSLLKGRKDREKAKKHQNKTYNDSDKKISFSDLLASLCIGSNGGINIITIWDLNYYTFQDQLKRMSWKEEFDINTRAAMAGAKIEKDKLSHWIKTMTFN